MNNYGVATAINYRNGAKKGFNSQGSDENSIDGYRVQQSLIDMERQYEDQQL